jgi:hypothetical protein
MLGAKLGYLDSCIAEVDYFLGDSVNLVAKDESEGRRGLRRSERSGDPGTPGLILLERDTGFGLFKGDEGVSLGFAAMNCIKGMFKVGPVD